MEQMDVTTGLRDVELSGISRSSSPELSNLCKYCRALLDWRWVPFRYPRLYHGLSKSNDLLYWAKKYLDHHESWSELKACSDSGCTLCQLFMSSGWEPFPNIGTGFRLFLLYEPANLSRSKEEATRFVGFKMGYRERITRRPPGPFFQIMAPPGEFFPPLVEGSKNSHNYE
jgi:hypothetical protein